MFASHQVGAAVAATTAGLVRDGLGSYDAAWYGAGALSIGAAMLSLLLLAGRRPPPIVHRTRVPSRHRPLTKM